MPDYYHAPALILICSCCPHSSICICVTRIRAPCSGFLGFLFAIVSMVMPYTAGPLSFYAGIYPWMAAAGQTSILISSALFLGSLSPLHFRIDRFNVLYVIPYTIPLVIYSALLYGIFYGLSPQRPLFFIFPALGALSLLVVCFWGAAKGSVPAWLGVAACICTGWLGVLGLLHAGSGLGADLMSSAPTIF